MAAAQLLIPLALILNVAALWAFLEAVDGGHFDIKVRAIAAGPALGAHQPDGELAQVLSPDQAPAKAESSGRPEVWPLRCC
jgi:hypothetical protein